VKNACFKTGTCLVVKALKRTPILLVYYLYFLFDFKITGLYYHLGVLELNIDVMKIRSKQQANVFKYGELLEQVFYLAE